MNRIWVDGCFDFFHHGHAGALNQARKLGDALVVGVHTDEEILANKGPVVMHLDERAFAVEACRWTSEVVTDAPYVTQFAVMDAHNCEYVAHGDDITTDANGQDCYQAAKDAGRFIVFDRTPNISTTDLINRMLTHTTAHHRECSPAFLRSADAQRRFQMYAKGPDARHPYAGVLDYAADFEVFVPFAWHAPEIVYTEGTFDLFHPGHIEFLQQCSKHGKVVVGLRSDEVVNKALGDGRPIMNTFERALCLLQCRYVDGVILQVPYATDGAQRIKEIENALDTKVAKVARGPTAPPPSNKLIPWAREHAKLLEVRAGKYAALSTDTIIRRVLDNRAEYEERQRKKGVKSEGERAMERKAKETAKERGHLPA